MPRSFATADSRRRHGPHLADPARPRRRRRTTANVCTESSHKQRPASPASRCPSTRGQVRLGVPGTAARAGRRSAPRAAALGRPTPRRSRRAPGRNGGDAGRPTAGPRRAGAWTCPRPAHPRAARRRRALSSSARAPGPTRLHRSPGARAASTLIVAIGRAGFSWPPAGDRSQCRAGWRRASTIDPQASHAGHRGRPTSAGCARRRHIRTSPASPLSCSVSAGRAAGEPGRRHAGRLTCRCDLAGSARRATPPTVRFLAMAEQPGSPAARQRRGRR